MKTIFSRAGCLIGALFTAQALFSHADFPEGGDGTEDSPYLITNADELNKIRNHASAYFQLEDDIDLTDATCMNETAGWTPINSFTGVLDGNNKAIRGFWTYGTDNNRALISSLSGAVKNLTLEISAKKIKGNRAGGIAAGAPGGKSATFINCHVIGDIDGNNSVGGIIGRPEGDVSISQCSYKGNITGTGGAYIGGFIGFCNVASTNLVIEKSYFSGHISGNSSVGGLIGELSNGSIQIADSYAEGAISGLSNIGGLIGASSSSGSIANAYATASITATNIANSGGAGGLIGNVNTASFTLENCVAINSTITVAGNTANYGTMIGRINADATVTNCRAFDGILVNEASIAPDSPDGRKNGAFLTKAEIVSQASYTDWDFEDTWQWGNAYYRLPVLKDLPGQPDVQPAHLPLSGDVTLNLLTISAGELDPDFSASETDYTANVMYIVESVDIAATASDAKTQLTGDTGTKALAVGENTFVITLAAEDQVNVQSYTIKITRADATTDAALTELTVSEGTLSPSFNPLIKEYTVNLPYAIDEIAITALPNSSEATFTGGDGEKTALEVGDNLFQIVVTAEDETTQETYLVNVIRAAASTDATLKTLTVPERTLSPAFNPEIKAYTVDIAYEITAITITAETNDANATLTGDGLKSDLPVGKTTFEIIVTAEDDKIQAIYTIEVNRSDSETASNGIDAGKIQISVKDRLIVVTGAQRTITLTSLSGVSQKYNTKGNTISLPVAVAGIYILSGEGFLRKIKIK
jgi:hypothetical protein